MKIRSSVSFIARAMLLIGTVWLSNQAQASPCDSSADPIIISSSCSNLVVSDAKSAISLDPGITINGDHGLLIQTVNGNVGTVTINSGSQIIGTVYSGIDNEGTITNLNNINLIQGIGNGISNFNVIGTINNSSGASIVGNDQGITNFGGAHISLLNNSGTISAANNYGIYNLGTIDWITNNLGGIINGVFAGIFNDSSGVITTLTNNGSITAAIHRRGIYNNGSINTLVNNGSITSVGVRGNGIYNDVSGTINTLINNGSITDGVGQAIYNNGSINTLINNGSITAGATGVGIYNSGPGIINTLTNNGAISVGDAGYGIRNLGTINTLNNNVSITTGANGTGISNASSATITTLTNNGSVNAGDFGIYNNGSINTLTNNSSITAGDNKVGIYNAGLGIINTLTNNGSIAAGVGGVGISNDGSITILNNAQGGVGSSPATTALTISGNMPINYNIIINSPTHYGQLVATAPSGTIENFGIYGTPFLTSRTYASVLTNNITVGNLQSKYDNMTLALVDNGSTYDLTFTGASLMGTQQSLVNTASVLQNTYALQNSVLANSFSYDCNVFGANDICVSAGGRNTAVSAANGLNNTSALLIAAYRLMPSVRIGAYADQNLSVNNAGSTVNLGNNTPLIGLFGAWNERLDGTGTEVKLSAAYGQKNTTVTRQVVGLSEPGSGSSNLNSQGAQVTAKYGFGVTPDVIVSPYVGMRYTQNNMNGYSEQATSSVTAPLTYSALNTNATTALAGVGVSYRVIPQVTTFASAGVETDTNTSNGTYSATGVSGLTPINFNASPVRTRPTATVGAYYDIEKSQRVGITGIYRQEPYQAVQTTTVMATYTIGL